jgi:hypothetical protein
MLDAHARGQQPLHGDASLSNLLAADSGPRWNDFEDVCVGTVKSDVAGVLSDARTRWRGDLQRPAAGWRPMEADSTRLCSRRSTRCTHCTEHSGAANTGRTVGR